MVQANTMEPSLHKLSRPDPLEAAVRGEVRERWERVLTEGLTAGLGAGGTATRCGSRNGGRPGGDSLGEPVGLRVPRGLLPQPEGSAATWQPRSLPRHPRRKASVDAAILGTSLAGANTRRREAAWKRRRVDEGVILKAVEVLRACFAFRWGERG